MYVLAALQDTTEAAAESLTAAADRLVAATRPLAAAVDSLAGAAKYVPPHGLNLAFWCLAVIFFGALVGTAELLSRYRDDPWRPLARPGGQAYVAINGFVSLVVFVLLISRSGSEVIFPKLATVWRAIIAGFGAMALLRSKFFTFRSASDEDIPVGVEAAISAFLQALDRGMDRSQSWERWDLAHWGLHDVPDQAGLEKLIQFCRRNLDSYQNLPASEVKGFEDAVAKLAAQIADPAGLRAIAVGITLQAIAGSDNFARLAVQFRKEVGLPVLDPKNPTDRHPRTGPAPKATNLPTA
jgi:hypothetical protein